MQKWLLWTEHQYRLPPVGKAFQELGGKELCAMSEEQFRQRSPLGGDVLHAHLDIWKSGGTWHGRAAPPELQGRDTEGGGRPGRQPGLLSAGAAARCSPSGLRSKSQPDEQLHPRIPGKLASPDPLPALVKPPEHRAGHVGS